MKGKFSTATKSSSEAKKTWEKWKVNNNNMLKLPARLSASSWAMVSVTDSFPRSTLTQLRTRKVFKLKLWKFNLSLHPRFINRNRQISFLRHISPWAPFDERRKLNIKNLCGNEIKFLKTIKGRKFINIQSWKIVWDGTFFPSKSIRRRWWWYPVISICDDADVKWKSMRKVFVLSRAASKMSIGCRLMNYWIQKYSIMGSMTRLKVKFQVYCTSR